MGKLTQENGTDLLITDTHTHRERKSTPFYKCNCTGDRGFFSYNNDIYFGVHLLCPLKCGSLAISKRLLFAANIQCIHVSFDLATSTPRIANQYLIDDLNELN